MKKNNVFTVLALASTFVLAGAAEFPRFQMKELEFETRITDQNTFREEEPIEIPRVSQRFYGEEELERLPIKRILIEGVIPHPDKGITQESIQALIDQKFQEQQGIELDENGFTARDLNDIGRFLREIMDRGSVPDLEDVNRLTEIMSQQELERGWITIEQLDSIALAVTEAYREKGFILATAFIPAQTVEDQVVKLSVLEGRLGDVVVSNNEIFKPETIKAAFSDEIGKPVTEEQIESALRRINDLPGVRVRGSFSPGDNVGETRLNLGVLQEKNWTSRILLDNHGSETTGARRIFATTEWLNIRDKGHRLALGILQSEGPDSTTYGLAEYEMPVTGDRRGKVKFSVSSNQFSVSKLVNLPEIIGKTNNYGVTASYQFLRGRTLNLGVEAGYVFKDVVFKVGQLTTLSTDQKIDIYNVAVDYTQLWDERQLLFTGRFNVEQGHIISGEIRDQSTDFTKVLINASLLKRFSIDNWLTKRRSFYNFVVKLNSQFSEKFLSSVEQFSLGGPAGVRAFGVSDISVDSGATVGFELFFDLPVDPMKKLGWPLEPLKPFVYYDYGYGVARQIGGSGNRDAIIDAYGWGVRINWPGKGVANLVYSKPLGSKYDENFLEETGKSRFYLDITYQIH